MLAWFTDSSGIHNKITFGTIDHEVGEEVSGLEKKNVGVEIKSTADTYVRVRVDIPSVINPTDGKVIKAVPVPEMPRGPDAENGTAGWIDGNDGYWYYSEAVKSESKDKGMYLTLFDSIGFSEIDKEKIGLLGDEDLKKLNITIYAESVQKDYLPEGIDGPVKAFAYFGGTSPQSSGEVKGDRMLYDVN